jgi:hypothetical protein
MTEPRVAVVHQMARTGGTLINRCLGSMRDIQVLSEVHPLDPQCKITRQAAHWFQLLSEEDKPWLRGLDTRHPLESFAAIVERLAERCTEQGRHLVLRDWSHLDFLGVPFVHQPPMQLLTERALRERCDLRQAFIVRHPLDQYASCAARPGMAPHLTPRRFVDAYLAFAQIAADRGYQRYEDFVADPDEELGRLCPRLRVPLDSSYRERWEAYDKLTGDNAGPSRGFAQRDIAALPARSLDEGILAALRGDPVYAESLELLGYEDLDP